MSWRRAGAVLFLCSALGGCSASSTGSTATSTPTTSSLPTSSPTPSGPAAATVALTGDGPVVGGPLTGLAISCFVPSFDGMSIRVSGTPTGQSLNGLFVNVTIRSGVVTVAEATGSGPQYRSRSFSGTGVSGFDAGTGAQLSGPLTETTAASLQKGTLGGFTSITGSVTCGNQTPGTTTVKLTGSTADGAFSGDLTSALVACNTSHFGQGVQVSAFTMVGTQRALLLINIERYINDPSVANAPAFSVFEQLQNAPGRFYTRSQGTFTVTTTGAHVDGDLIEQVSGGATPHTLHLSGDATCGSTNTSA
jgi:hypothetical protein